MTTNTTSSEAQKPVDLGELRARLQPSLLVTFEKPLGHLEPGDKAMAQFWGNGAVMLYPINPQRQPSLMRFTHDIEAAGVRLADETEHSTKNLLPGELRARLQPMVMLRILAPVESKKGMLRFSTGDLVMAQFWGGGSIILNPVRMEDQPSGWFFTHSLDGKVALAELGQLKGVQQSAIPPIDPDDPDQLAGWHEDADEPDQPRLRSLMQEQSRWGRQTAGGQDHAAQALFARLYTQLRAQFNSGDWEYTLAELMGHLSVATNLTQPIIRAAVQLADLARQNPPPKSPAHSRVGDVPLLSSAVTG